MEDMSKVCDRFQQFCANSAKPLLYSGGFVTLISAVALGYVAYTSHELYDKIDTTETDKKSLPLNFYLQLTAAAYLLLITIIVLTAAYYDNKYAIRVVSSLIHITYLSTNPDSKLTRLNQTHTVGHLGDNQCRLGACFRPFGFYER